MGSKNTYAIGRALCFVALCTGFGVAAMGQMIEFPLAVSEVTRAVSEDLDAVLAICEVMLDLACDFACVAAGAPLVVDKQSVHIATFLSNPVGRVCPVTWTYLSHPRDLHTVHCSERRR